MARLDIPRRLHNLPQQTAAEMAAQFQRMLELCGIPQEGRDFLVNQGIMSATQFIKLSLDSEIKDLKKLAVTVHVTPQGGFPPLNPDPNDPVAIAATAAASTNRNPGIDIPYMAWLNLHALLAYTISLHQCGLMLDYHNFDHRLLTKWCEYISDEYGIDHETPKDPPKLKNLEDWFDFKEALQAWALDKRGHSLDTPVAYLLRGYV